MPSLVDLHAYVRMLAQAMSNLNYGTEDTPPVVGSLSQDSADHFSVTCNGGSKLFDISSDGEENIKVNFYYQSKPTETQSTHRYWIAEKIPKFLEKKYICGLKVPFFKKFEERASDEDQQDEFQCISLDALINDFKGDVRRDTNMITEKLQMINEGIEQKIVHANKQIEKLNLAKSKIREVTAESAKWIDLLRGLDEKLSDIQAKSPPSVGSESY